MNDKEYFDALYREMYEKLYRFALVRASDHYLAEELVQDVFVLAQERMDKLRASPDPQGWLVKALGYELKHALRTKQLLLSKTMTLEQDLPSDERGAEGELGLEAFLTQDEWELATMIYCGGWSIAQAAERLGVSFEACRKRLHRLRKKIKEKFVP